MIGAPTNNLIHLLSPSPPQLDMSSMLSNNSSDLNSSQLQRTRKPVPSIHLNTSNILSTTTTNNYNNNHNNTINNYCSNTPNITVTPITSSSVYRSSSSSSSQQQPSQLTSNIQARKPMNVPNCIPPKLNLDFKLPNNLTPKTNSVPTNNPAQQNYTLTNLNFEIPSYTPITLGKQSSVGIISDAINQVDNKTEDGIPKKAKMRKNFSLGSMGSYSNNNNTTSSSSSRPTIKDASASPFSHLSIEITTPSNRGKTICTDRATPGSRNALSPNAFQPFKSPNHLHQQANIKVADALSYSSNRQNSKPKAAGDIPVMVVSIPNNTYSVYNNNSAKPDESLDKTLNSSMYSNATVIGSTNSQANISNSKLQYHSSQRNSVLDSTLGQSTLRQASVSSTQQQQQPPSTRAQSGVRSKQDQQSNLQKQQQQLQASQIGSLVRTKKEMVDSYSDSSTLLMKQVSGSLESLNKKEIEITKFLEEQAKCVETIITNCVETLFSLKQQSNGFFSSLIQSVGAEYKEARDICECSLEHLQATQADIISNYSSILHEFDHCQVSQVIGAYCLRSGEVSQFLNQINNKELSDLVFRFDGSESTQLSFNNFQESINSLMNTSLKKLKTPFMKPADLNVSPPSKRQVKQQGQVTPPSTASTALKRVPNSSQVKLSFVSPTHSRKNNSISSNSSSSVQRYKTPTTLQFKDEFTPTASRTGLINNDSSFFVNLESSFTAAQQESSKSEKQLEIPRKQDPVDPLRLKLPLETQINLEIPEINSQINSNPVRLQTYTEAVQLKLNLSPQIEQLKVPVGLPRAPVKVLERQVKSVQHSTQIPPKSVYVSFDNKDAFQKMESNSKAGKKNVTDLSFPIEEDTLGTFRNLQVQEREVNIVEKTSGDQCDDIVYQSAEKKKSNSNLRESSEVRYESKENTPNFSNKKHTSLGESGTVVEYKPYEFDFLAVEKTLKELLNPNTTKDNIDREAEAGADELAKQQKRSRENSLSKIQSYNEMLRIVQQNQINRTQNCESILRRVSEGVEVSSTTSSTTTGVPSVHFRSDSASGSATGQAMFFRSSFTIPQSSGRILLQESQSGALKKQSLGAVDGEDQPNFCSQRLSYEGESQMMLCSNQALKLASEESNSVPLTIENNNNNNNSRFFSQRYSPIQEENEHSSVNPLGTTQNSDIKLDQAQQRYNYQLFGSLHDY